MAYTQNNWNYVDELPVETVQMQYRNFVDPEFWRENEGDYNYSQPGYVIINGRPVLNTTLIKNLGLEVSNNENDFSDPGAGDMPNSNSNAGRIRRVKRLHNVSNNSNSNYNSRRIRKSVAVHSKSTRAKKSATKKGNNRFGFKKVFGALGRGIKKLTGRTRRNRL